jgi:hypothetical protein
MNNQEIKQKQFEEVLTKYKHLESYCTIECAGLDDDDIYFHTTFRIDENVSITSQSDIKSITGLIYATRFTIIGSNYCSVDIDEELLMPVIIGYRTNKDVVMLAMNTLSSIRTHINNIQCYTSDYVINILIGNSIKNISQHIVNELNATSLFVEFLKKQSVKQ